jgi:curved DNA-binding protein CbpA
MSGTVDHYAVLQVDPRAELDVIQAAYRTLARKYHPDVGGGSHDRMTALNNAWAVLRDPAARAAYDQLRTASIAPYRSAAGRTNEQTVSRPPGNGSGSVLDFGRYAGWSLGELSRHDPDFLEWLARSPGGRRYRGEIERLLSGPAHAPVAVGRRHTGRLRFR